MSGVQHALEHLVLDPLAVVDALLGDLPQPPAAGGVLCVYVVGDQNQHGASLPQKGRVAVQVAPERSGQEQGLDVGDQAPGELLF